MPRPALATGHMHRIGGLCDARIMRVSVAGQAQGKERPMTYPVVPLRAEACPDWVRGRRSCSPLRDRSE
jgi:hypothetical protein